ncbi:hypothetical protein PN36_00725 [Candidatus Thiomargarita nelsonii]|uniref:Uncharacterized protein n=1 Tax=Candidatus Thiomargarita nelsonii TaxID=1003181 RepID=A0A0A6PAX4_9GAMM|nr:hypothetical protein PN36_00725 [Candidatus Thiomargarita nelsonii]
MQALELKSDSLDGIIKIPETHKEWYGKILKVIFLGEIYPKSINIDAEKAELEHFFDQFNSDFTGLSFNRDEANER